MIKSRTLFYKYIDIAHHTDLVHCISIVFGASNFIATCILKQDNCHGEFKTIYISFVKGYAFKEELTLEVLWFYEVLQPK